MLFFLWCWFLSTNEAKKTGAPRASARQHMKKQISFPHKFVVSFKQKRCVAQNAIVVADIDNDPKGDLELAVGGIGGELAIYKFNKLNPWKSCDGLGSINCMCVGDIRGNKKNSLVVLTGEGVCFIFDITSGEEYLQPTESGPQVSISPNIGVVSPGTSVPPNLGPTLESMPNTPGGSHGPNSPNFETTSAATTPKSVLKTPNLTRPSSPSRTKRVHFQKVSTKDQEWFTDIITPSFSHRCIQNANVAIITDLDEDHQNELIVGTSGREVVIYALVHTGPNNDILCLQQKRKIPVQEKAHSLSASFDMWGRAYLFVGQKSSGAPYVIIDHNYETHMPKKEESGEPPLEGTPVEVKHISRPSLSLTGAKQSPTLCAMISLDGSVTLKENDNILWNINVKQQLFSIRSLPLSGNGEDDIVVSSWDGTTYLIDQRNNLVEFQFEDQLSAFTAGYYSISPGNSVPCLFYVTFFDEIFIYYNIASIPLFEAQLDPKADVTATSGLEGMDLQSLQALKTELLEKLNKL